MFLRSCMLWVLKKVYPQEAKETKVLPIGLVLF